MYEGRLRELANIEKLEVAEPIQLQDARAQSLDIVYGKWIDDVKWTPEDPEAVRSRLVATQVNTYAREDITQATPPIKASGIKLQRKQMRRDRHQSGVLPCEGERASRDHSSKGIGTPGVGWRCVKARYGTREASKCWEMRSLTH